jgi:predicted RND superfamily exporter protein
MSKSRAIVILILVSAVTLGFALLLPQTKFDYDFDKFFKPEDPITRYFEKHRNTFGTDNDFILIGIVNNNGVFEESFLEKIEQLGDTLATIPYVNSVVDPTSLKVPIRESLTGAIFQAPLLSGNRIKDSTRVFNDPSVVNSFFSRDTTAISMLLITEEKLSKSKCDTVSIFLHNILESYEFDGVHTAGRALGQVVYINKIQNEFIFFLGLSVALVTIILFFLFRTLRGVIIPLVTVLLAVIWSIGILNLSGRGIGILLNMLPPVIFVVGMSDAVHLYSRYIEELRRGMTKEYAIKQVIFDTGLATLLTSITTAIGFASLYFTGIPSLQEFGLITAAGVLAAFIIAITILPAWLTLSSVPQKSIDTIESSLKKNWLASLFTSTIRSSKKIFLIAGVLTFLLFLAGTQLKLNNFLLEDLRPSEPLRKNFEFFDTYFSGVRPFELGVKSKDDTSLIDSEGISDIEMVQEILRDQYGVRTLYSVAEVAKSANRSRNAGRSDHYKLPETEGAWKKINQDIEQLSKSGKLESILSEDHTYARITGRVGDWGAQAFKSRNQELNNKLEELGLNDTYEIEITGTGTLIDQTNQNLVGSLGKGLGSAFILISILMGFMFKELKMIVIALVPNFFPLIALGAIMGLSGIDLKMSTSIIFTIAFGIAVDDTIHMLSRYKIELSKGKTSMTALKNAYIYTGKALIITTIILLGGFLGLCFSTFQSTFYIGLLVSLTLVIALVCDLTLLPAILAYVKRSK